jgi:broad-specificity NMP kinase
MPYIEKSIREPYDEIIASFIGKIFNAGDLNYVLTKILQLYAKEHIIRYATLNEIIGVLECCKQEFYSRIIRPYEDTKIQENGDVF